ncbi:GPI ethanolamine phosphate transferase 2 isoform X2 [Nilaparvata lugens]|uniref:GPI ethanolamine phosphate transferase 2 isoform X2 n=1 Tax=Nilaparvata lugens TaxID=108931 RepID=UPI00193E0FF2|nr:GPI ethanolamine phosphate transferase 2 isoform X2 [Nilaparvata lugens]
MRNFNKRLLYFYCANCATFSMLVFLNGFFPIKNSSYLFSSFDDYPSHIDDIFFDPAKVFEAKVHKTVIVVIDALRYDFVSEPAGTLNIPYLDSLVKQGYGCLHKMEANSPTVTMPRLKAVMTGSVSNFIDVVMNFGSPELQEDNVIYQLSERYNVTFFGDDTWLKLFPKKFTRSEGTTSFYVSDYTEVDNNVTRNVVNELERSDWDVMILHYLGLDHIGHLEGAGSPLIRTKLNELDKVIHSIHNHLLNWESLNNKSSLMLVFGDHGMRDAGGHGGASYPEILVPLLTFGLQCTTVKSHAIAQVDVAPTLSLLLGTPIPINNVGRLITDLYTSFPLEQLLYALYYNSQQVLTQFIDNGGSLTHESFLLYKEAVRQHTMWLKYNQTRDAANVVRLYEKALKTMSSYLIKSMVEFHIIEMVLAVFILSQVTLIAVLNVIQIKVPSRKNVRNILLIIIVMCFACWLIDSPLTPCCSSTLSSLSFVLLSIFVAVINCLILLSSTINENYKKVESVIGKCLGLGSFLLVIAMGSTSLIEEEQFVWYHMWTLLCAVAIMSVDNVAALTKWMAVLVIHRLARDMHTLGSSWLNHRHNKTYLSSISLIGLMGVWLSCIRTNNMNSWLFSTVDSILPGLSVILVYVYHSSTNKVHLALENYNFGLLLRPHNIWLLPAILLTSNVMVSALKGTVQLTIGYHWLGMVFYFYQGNTNSLASIDVAAGYVGQEVYNPIVTGLMIIIHTFAFPVLSFLCLLSNIFKADWRNELVVLYRVEALLLLLQLLNYTSLMIFQRYHLFIWSVFSPKLLYLSAHSLLTLILLWITEFFIFINYTAEKIVPSKHTLSMNVKNANEQHVNCGDSSNEDYL